MNEIEAKQQAAQRALIPGRLLKGASIIARLWREGKRCGDGWNSLCRCNPQNDFCAVKAKWVALDEEFRPHAEILIGRPTPFKVIEEMTLRELAATGLTIEIEWNGNKVKVGPKGTSWSTIKEIFDLPEEVRPEGWNKTAKLLAALAS